MREQARHIVTICGTQLRRIVVDRSAALVLVAMPLAIIFVLGISLRSLMAPEFLPEQPFRVAVVAPPTQIQKVQAVFESRPHVVTVEIASDADAARRKVVQREVDVAAIVPDAFPQASMELIGVPGSPSTEIVRAMLHAVASRVDEARTQGVTVRRTEVEVVASAERDELPEWLFTDAFGYYAVAVTTMFAMFSANTAMVISGRDRVTDAYARIRTLGVRPASYMVAAAMTSAIVGALFITVMSGTTSVLFGVAWGGVPSWAILTAVGAVALAALCLVVMALAPTEATIEGTGSAVFMVLSFLGGSMTPLHVLPTWFRTSLAWLPNRALLTGYLKLARGGSLESIAGELTSLLLCAAVLFTIGWIVWTLRSRGDA